MNAITKFVLGLFALAWIVLIAARCEADELGTEDRASEITWQTIHAIDWYQTDMIARHPRDFHEVDSAWLIGAHPSRGKVAVFMLSGAALHYTITRQLADNDAPLWMRRFWHASSIAFAAGAVRANFSIGLKP